MNMSTSKKRMSWLISFLLFILIFLFLIQPIQLLSQRQNTIDKQEISLHEYVKQLLANNENADKSQFKYIPKKPGHYSAEDWREVIDSTWGDGLPTYKKLQIFDLFWNTIDEKYAGFFNLDANWDSLYNHYRPIH